MRAVPGLRFATLTQTSARLAAARLRHSGLAKPLQAQAEAVEQNIVSVLGDSTTER